jgi:hypothetical protein
MQPTAISKREFILSMRRPVYIGVLIACLVIVLHAMASDFGWYWIFRWFDNPMHVFGGIFAGYCGLLLHTFMTMDVMRKTPPLIVPLLSSLAIGILWEVLEYQYGLSGLDPLHRFDALKDIINDMIGGVVSLAVWHFFIQKKPQQ